MSVVLGTSDCRCPIDLVEESTTLTGIQMQVNVIRRHISILALHWDHLIFPVWVETVALSCSYPDFRCRSCRGMFLTWKSHNPHR